MYSRLFVHTFPIISFEQPRIFVGVSGIHFERPQVVCKCVFDCVWAVLRVSSMFQFMPTVRLSSSTFFVCRRSSRISHGMPLIPFALQVSRSTFLDCDS